MQPGFPETTTTADNNGRFVFEAIDPAVYLLSAQHAGYLDQHYGTRYPGILGSGLDVRSGTKHSDVVLAMTPQSIIAGDITDQDGDPVGRGQLHVYQTHWFDGIRRILQVASVAMNPDGTFMVGNLPPGRYYIEATAERSSNWLPTFFPATTDFSAAAPIDVQPGADIRGIHLRIRPGKGFWIRGHLSAVARNMTLRLIPKSPDPQTVLRYEDPGLSDRGEFAIPNVPPGSYTIVAAAEQEKLGLGYAEVTVDDRDITDLSIVFGPGIEITGNVRMEDGSPPAEPVSLTLLSHEAPYESAGSETDEKGGFHLDELLPHRYRVEVTGVPGAYVKSIRFAGREAAPGNIDLSAGGGMIDIVLSLHAASVSGVIRGKDGNAAPFAMYEIWPGVPVQLPSASTADENGHFTVSNLAPGEYSIAAWPTVDPSVLQNPGFLARFESSATKVTLRKSSSASATVTMNDAETTATEIARLP